ncbi:MAG: hypothetical protein F6J87_20035 [Spirulina sp. SIO3F2]|nr:hypothetical protein [Spirulina sp. SIO3F2]
MLLFASLFVSFAFALTLEGALLNPALAISPSPTFLVSTLYQTHQDEQATLLAYEPDNNGNPEDSSGAGGRFVPQDPTPLREIEG